MSVAPLSTLKVLPGPKCLEQTTRKLSAGLKTMNKAEIMKLLLTQVHTWSTTWTLMSRAQTTTRSCFNRKCQLCFRTCKILLSPRSKAKAKGLVELQILDQCLSSKIETQWISSTIRRASLSSRAKTRAESTIQSMPKSNLGWWRAFNLEETLLKDTRWRAKTARNLAQWMLWSTLATWMIMRALTVVLQQPLYNKPIPCNTSASLKIIHLSKN